MEEKEASKTVSFSLSVEVIERIRKVRTVSGQWNTPTGFCREAVNRFLEQLELKYFKELEKAFPEEHKNG